MPIQPLPLFQGAPEIIRVSVMMWLLFPLSLRNVEGILDERGIEISHALLRAHANMAEVRLSPCLGHNHFPMERHLQNRDACKQIRATAVAEWRGLSAA